MQVLTQHTLTRYSLCTRLSRLHSIPVADFIMIRLNSRHLLREHQIHAREVAYVKSGGYRSTEQYLTTVAPVRHLTPPTSVPHCNGLTLNSRSHSTKAIRSLCCTSTSRRMSSTTCPSTQHTKRSPSRWARVVVRACSRASDMQVF